MNELFRRSWIFALALVPIVAFCAQGKTGDAPEVKISGGFETDARDRGRPVVLIVAGLGVPPEVFREAFSHVHPAPAGQEPDPRQVQENKGALLRALGSYGVTNENLDRVSNYYRYNRNRGEWWPVRQAKVAAIVSEGVVTGFKITDPGSGYSSPPVITVPGHREIVTKVTLSYGKDLAKNGSIASVKIVRP